MATDKKWQGTKVLHLFAWNGKFVLPFMQLVRENFPKGQHEFVVYGNFASDEVPVTDDTLLFPRLFSHLVSLSKALQAADRIVLHGLFNTRLLLILAFQPWLLKRCYWVIWGGDLYLHQSAKRNWRWRRSEYLRQLVIKHIGHLVSFIEGDIELARKWYGARGQFEECLVYPTNLYQDLDIEDVQHSGFNILIGNSADPSNNHMEILERLRAFKKQNITIYAPLSYGNTQYAQKIVEVGKDYFGDNFKPLTNFLPYDEYIRFLGSVDIAIFNHERQQAMGNTITLLGLGKKVYLRKGTTSWNMFVKKGFEVFDGTSLKLSKLEEEIKVKNRKLVIEKFSKERLINQLKQLFGG